jgi:outer membrane protein TolC
MNNFLQAALSHYQAQKDEAIAVLEVYFEVLTWTEKLTDAEENIETLKKFVELEE